MRGTKRIGMRTKDKGNGIILIAKHMLVTNLPTSKRKELIK
jgi:hypothetical protein